MQPPDITRVFKGPENEFEVEIVHQITVKKAPVKLVIIHPERQE